MKAWIFLLVMATLFVASPAAAKGPIELEICGSSECRGFGWAPRERAHETLVTGLVALYDDFTFVSAPPLAGYYELRLTADWYAWDRAFYVPTRAVAEVQSSWVRIPSALAAALRGATVGLEPRPRPTLERVVVNGHPVDDAAAYAGVFDHLGTAQPPPPETPRAELELRASAANPWTDERKSVEYFPSANVIHRETEWVVATAALAERIEADLAEAARAHGAGPAWPSYLSLAALVAGGGGLAWLRLGRRRSRARAT
jgi:hypothetical protein